MKLVLNELIEYRLISIEYGESTTYYTATPLNRSVASKMRCIEYRSAQEKIAQRDEDKSELK